MDDCGGFTCCECGRFFERESQIDAHECETDEDYGCPRCGNAPGFDCFCEDTPSLEAPWWQTP